MHDGHLLKCVHHCDDVKWILGECGQRNAQQRPGFAELLGYSCRSGCGAGDCLMGVQSPIWGVAPHSVPFAGGDISGHRPVCINRFSEGVSNDNIIQSRQKALASPGNFPIIPSNLNSILESQLKTNAKLQNSHPWLRNIVSDNQI